MDQYHDLPLTAEHLNRRFDGLDIGFTLGRITRFGGQRTSHKYRTFTKIFAYFSFRDLSHNMGTASTYRHVIPKGNAVSILRKQYIRRAAALIAASLMSFGATSAMASRGINGWGETGAYFDGSHATETYSKGFYCDTSVTAKSSSGCELGQAANRPPGPYDPEYAITPVGFSVPPMQMNCASHLVCIDHPATLDQSRVAKPLAKAMKTTVAALLPMLGNTPLPGHDHFLTTLHNGAPEWWNVEIIPVTSRATYDAILRHRSYRYIQTLLAAKDPTLMKAVPTNLFLYFAAARNSSNAM